MQGDVLRNRDFKRLVRLLNEPVPHILGYLLMLWHSAIESDDANFGDAVDVEAAAGYSGPNRAFAAVFADCGFLDRSERIDGSNDYSLSHDWNHHSPWCKSWRSIATSKLTEAA